MFTKKTSSQKQKAHSLIVSDDIYSQSLDTLKNLGINVYSSYTNTAVSAPLQKHVDMQLVHICANTYLCAPQCFEYYDGLSRELNFKLICGDTYLSSNYPNDIAYNIIVTEKYAVHNTKYTDSILMQNLKNKKIINVSQGYSACCVCKIADDAFITSDNGVYRALSDEGCNVLIISGGNILLPGFDEGFIGGASFMLSPQLLAINGNIDMHPDCSLIKKFCKRFGVNVLSLSDNPIMDIGSAVAI